MNLKIGLYTFYINTANMNSNLSEEYLYYTKQGEKLKMVYKLADFLNNPQTKQILEEEWMEKFRKEIEEPLTKIIENEKKEQENKGTLLFRKDRGGQFTGEVMNELFYHIKPKYDLEIFYNNPDLAKNLDN
jgi:hypothetical protein